VTIATLSSFPSHGQGVTVVIALFVRFAEPGSAVAGLPVRQPAALPLFDLSCLRMIAVPSNRDRPTTTFFQLRP